MVQLRLENLRADSYNLVGFQNHLKFGEQKRILRMIPGLENAEFLRYGQIHRNTYINAPALLNATLQLREHNAFSSPARFRAWKAMSNRLPPGWRRASRRRLICTAKRRAPFPRETAIGSLCHYISHADPRTYQPANIAFDLFPAPDPPLKDRAQRQAEICRVALEKLEQHAVAHV